MQTQLTAPLDAPGLPLALAGGKGANLSAMLAAGFPVPNGFVVLTGAYHRFVADNSLQATISTQWQACDSQSPQSYEAAAQAIRAAFLAGDIADDLAAAIRTEYAALARVAEAAGTRGATPSAAAEKSAVAVRSSATAEDLPDASFAGQQDTYLNIRGAEAVLDAVRRCWASLWTGRAMAYRHRQEISPDDVGLAVVVQQMVPATAAGVLFTVNPLTGDAAEMMINATWGLGEALVSGHVTPDTIVADSATGEVKQVILGDKQLMTAPVDGGTAEVAVPPAQQAQQALAAAEVAVLVQWGRRLAEHFGKPQDVEWAIAGGEIVLLQARPITTLAAFDAAPSPAPAALSDTPGAVQLAALPFRPPGDDAWPPADLPPQPFDLWTTYDVGERWPEPVTPFSWSTGYAMIQQNMDETLAGLKAPYAGKIQWARRAYGHVYLNEGALTYAYNDGLGLPMGAIAPSMSGVIPVTAENNRYQWSKVLRHLPFYARSFTQWERNVARYVAAFPQIEASVDAFMRRPLTGLTDAELWRQAEQEWLARAMVYMRAHSNATSLSLTAYSQLEEFTAQAMGDRNLATQLAGGISGVIAAEIVPALWQLARTIEQQGLAGIVLEQPSKAALAELRRTPAAGDVMRQFDAFLSRHGHRCMSEAEWLHPRWVEAPHLVVESIAGYLRAGASFDPTDAVAKAEQERLAATAAVEGRVSGVQRTRFHWLLGRVHRFMLARDNGQHYLVKLMLPVRRLYAALAARWAQRGWLSEADDFFFLVLEEVEAVIATGSPQDAHLALPAIAAARREAYTFWFGKPMPDVLDARGIPVAFAAAREQSADGTVLVGLAASRGEVTGIARVVMTPQEAASIRPGEILVTRATDPGWTPVFSVISAAVIEIGSTLSHAAIVAREYGLPAVVNIPQATQLIRDGQQIRVDGSRGRVTLLD
jgi:pyruvate,water dikinase